MLIYFLQVNIYAALFWALYLLLLKDRSITLYCKAFLWCALLAATLLPLVQLPASATASGSVSGAEVTILAIQTVQQIKTGADSAFYLPYLYAAIVLLLLLHMLVQGYRLRVFIKKQQWAELDGYQVALATGIGPASFGRYIFFPGKDIHPEIFAHEKAHARLSHQWERRLLQIFLCFFFPVLPIYFIRREIKLLQEFEADRLAAHAPQAYCRLLLNQTLGSERFPLLPTFYHQPLKRRIMMLQQPPQKRLPKLLLLTTAGLVIAGIVLQSHVAVFAQKKSEAIPPTVAASEESEDRIYSSVEQMPEFPGGQDALLKFLSTNIQYPATARKAGIEGRVVSRFVVGTDGTIEDIRIQRGLNPECDAEVIRIIKAMPQWTPAKQNGKMVKVYYTLPVSFRLQ